MLYDNLSVNEAGHLVFAGYDTTDLAAQYGENFAANANIVEYGMLDDLYPGMSNISTNQLVIYQPMMGAVVCEIALAEVTNASDVSAVKGIFQARIDAQVNGGAWYPESIEGWKNNSRIVTNGNYVMMIAWQYCDDAVSSFNNLFCSLWAGNSPAHF